MGKEWVDQVIRSVEGGRKVNIVHFNVNDKFVHNGEVMKVRQILEQELGMRGYIYASPGAGIRFSDDATELFFRQAAGLPTPPKDPGPMPLEDEATEADKALWLQDYEDWTSWCKATAKYNAAGVSVLRALPPVSPVDALTLTGLLSQFISFLPNPLDENGDPVDPMEVVRPSDFAIIIEYADAYLTQIDTKGFDQKVLSTAVREWSESQGVDLPVILLTADALADLDKTLYGRGSATGVVEVPYPDFDERLDFVLATVNAVKAEFAPDIDAKSIARETAGLANRHIEAMIAEAYVTSSVIDHDYIRQYKEATLQSELNGLVEVMCPIHGFEAVGGLMKAKATLDKVGSYLKSDKTTLCPMGILFTGPPGTGKTWLAECWAHDLGYTFIKLGTFRSKWQGESERNLDKVFQIAKALAPVIIFVDEIDQEGQRGGGESDGGVGGRIFGTILKFMSDTSLRGKVLWIAATNRPELMDPAMKRPGRFDIRIPFPFPRDAERQDIFRAMVKKYDLDIDSAVDFRRLTEMTTKYSGADIEAVCLEAARLADVDGGTIGVSHFARAIDDYMTHHDEKSIRKMEVAAYKECNSKSLLPDDVIAEMEKKKSAKSPRVSSKEV